MDNNDIVKLGYINIGDTIKIKDNFKSFITPILDNLGIPYTFTVIHNTNGYIYPQDYKPSNPDNFIIEIEIKDESGFYDFLLLNQLKKCLHLSKCYNSLQEAKSDNTK